MGHLHNASGCPCCEAMGVTVRSYAEIQQFKLSQHERVTTEGLDHIYQNPAEAPEQDYALVETESAEDNPVTVDIPAPETQEFNHLTSLVRHQASMLLEQGNKLESANYRIGYLEAQVLEKDQQLRLLTSQRKSWLTSFTRWFVTPANS